ncbi:Ger(x)C family spore germination protein [Salinibacillus xinjiangensis]|uniref:Ger(X)C family spore germination protein n=1 Tax=Salinibacillus xinjiangensis TaxID=1229268 RepID=A0A6G1XAM8_9BACI|nr:Ger(x)C family spore germination protein [Salinibacillus xinjiangensis]MRG87930.1 Ger(x)C family spore germination protein [Salinibacillus xinjiangensis]
MKTLFQTCMLICTLVVLSSCGFKDIDKRSFVVSMGIDQSQENEKNYEVILKIAFPSSEANEQGKNFQLATETGRTIAEAVSRIKAKTSNELDFGHMKIIVLGEKILERDIGQTMDWFTRRRDIQQIAFIGVGKPTAREVLAHEPKGERLPSNELFLFFGETGTESPYVTTNYLFHFRRNLEERGIDGYLPIIEVKDDIFSIMTMCLVKKGEKPLPLKDDETELFNLLNRGYDKVSIKIQGVKQHFILSIDQLSSSYQILSTDSQKPVIKYKVNIKGNIEESMVEIKEEKMDQYNQLVEQVVKKRTEALFKKLQDSHYDPLGFGLRYRANHSGDENVKVKEWQNIYDQIRFDVNVKANITGTGVIE